MSPVKVSLPLSPGLVRKYVSNDTGMASESASPYSRPNTVRNDWFILFHVRAKCDGWQSRKAVAERVPAMLELSKRTHITAACGAVARGLPAIGVRTSRFVRRILRGNWSYSADEQEPQRVTDLNIVVWGTRPSRRGQLSLFSHSSALSDDNFTPSVLLLRAFVPIAFAEKKPRQSDLIAARPLR
jgi:hypothetical protein